MSRCPLRCLAHFQALHVLLFTNHFFSPPGSACCVPPVSLSPPPHFVYVAPNETAAAAHTLCGSEVFISVTPVSFNPAFISLRDLSPPRLSVPRQGRGQGVLRQAIVPNHSPPSPTPLSPLSPPPSSSSSTVVETDFPEGRRGRLR